MQSRASSFVRSHPQAVSGALAPHHAASFHQESRYELEAWPDWRGPTVIELADRVEHQFGDLPALPGVHSLGFASDEPLTPWDVREVCDLLGVPAEDLGLDV